MIDPKLRVMLTTIRAALIMAAKAIEKYLGEESKPVIIGDNDTVTTV